MKFSHLAVLAVVLNASEAFVVPGSQSNTNALPVTSQHIPYNTCSSSACWSKAENQDDGLEKSRRSKLRNLFSKAKKSLAFVTLASAALVSAPKMAEASAPVMAMPKAEARDPLTDALEIHQKKKQAQAQEELREFSAKARKIEAEEGKEARARFEDEYKAKKDMKAKERLERIKQVKYDLLDQGICPFTDVEGQRRVFEAEKGLDPAKVPGTRFYMEKDFEEKKPQKSFAVQKQPNREMVKAMVEDMKNRGMDPLEYFETHREKIASILELPAAQATAYANKYRENLESYGQITPPKEGEISAKEQMAKSGKKEADDKAEAKRMKAEAKAKAADAKAAAKAEAKELKAKAKAEKEAAKKATKEEKERAKQAVATAAAGATAAAATAAGAAENAASAVADMAESTQPAQQTESIIDESKIEGSAIVTEEEGGAPATIEKSSKKGIPILPLSGVVVAVGGGGYALKIMREKSQEAEAERQRQFKLLMGGMEEEDELFPSSAPALEEEDADMSGFKFEEEKSKPIEKQQEDVAPKKKKKRGVFGKKKSGRETDINNLVSSEAKASEFAKLLAKILTHGAPGRFPEIVALPGEMPLDGGFDVDAACSILTEAQASSDLSKEEAAEVFANVVNCMLIDIVDLASTSLKEKDEKLTVDAIGIVVDFMMHASSLYNSIAEGVVITPVTYGGDLRKGTLEQMYTAYAASGMTNFMSLDEDFENRVSLLQDVFQINEKKAEGLVMKAVQKNMMEALKSGKGLEGMEDMMKGMDMDGLAGMPGMGEDGEMDPEQLKEVLQQLKIMKDSGAIPKEEMQEVREQFKKAYGSSIDDVIKEADQEGSVNAQDKELLELMKSVLYDD